MKKHCFRQEIEAAFHQTIDEKNHAICDDYLQIDLHCHDHNSDIPDELWGRILRLPETWLKTEDQIANLKRNGSTAFTITNHNNARSCWDLLNQGHDVLTAAEFTCFFPEYQLYIHILAYGFNQTQEKYLNDYRRNIYRFLSYALEHNIPTILPHPLYFYKKNGQPPVDFFEKIALLFERFEILNGQRDIWQNLLAYEWVQSLDEEKIDSYSKKHGINPHDFCLYPYHKRLSGGSDDHMGLFSGLCGTRLIVPDLYKRRQKESVSEIVLDCIRSGQMVPFGMARNEEKLNIAILDYFCQVGMHMKDPGLIRMFLHHGELSDKLICLAISNAFQELKRHKYTSKFLKVFHNALRGKRPGFINNWSVNKDYKPILEDLDHIAKSRKRNSHSFDTSVSNFIPNTFAYLNSLLVERVEKTFQKHISQLGTKSLAEIIEKIELSSHLRNLFSNDEKKQENTNNFNLSNLLDQLSFPSLVSAVLASSTFISTHVLYSGRSFLNDFSKRLNKYQHPERVLWLTDSFFDSNGVSTVLQSTLKLIQQYDLDIDILVCDDHKVEEDHLIVIKPVSEFSLDEFSEQRFRIPNILDLQRIFLEGAYDRIVCSTELFMGLFSLYLKKAFSVPVYFYMHTDWLDYFAKTSKIDSQGLDRVRRIMRALYKQFDGIFVLNSDHKKWLASGSMEYPESKIHTTYHWVDDIFKPKETRISSFIPDYQEGEKILLYVGRLSEEKGLLDFVDIFKHLNKEKHSYRFVFAGKGLLEERLKKELPDANFLSWVEHEKLPELYSASDLLLLPSRFDTFACVVLEAMQCGLPVIAYNTKGPKDIIEHGKNGFLVDSPQAFSEYIELYFDQTKLQTDMKNFANKTRSRYQPEKIFFDFCLEIKLDIREKMPKQIEMAAS